jgi:hypothetical protein
MGFFKHGPFVIFEVELILLILVENHEWYLFLQRSMTAAVAYICSIIRVLDGKKEYFFTTLAQKYSHNGHCLQRMAIIYLM